MKKEQGKLHSILNCGIITINGLIPITSSEQVIVPDDISYEDKLKIHEIGRKTGVHITIQPVSRELYEKMKKSRNEPIKVSFQLSEDHRGNDI